MTQDDDPGMSGRVDEGERRPRSIREGGVVELREITAETVRAVCRLEVAPEQRRFVAENAVSLAEALFEPRAWYRAVIADGILVGFVMLFHDDAAAYYSLWRLMIADGFQGLGFGRAAVDLVVDHVRSLPNASELMVGYQPGEEGPERFYAVLGFEPTGEGDGHDVLARLRL